MKSRLASLATQTVNANGAREPQTKASRLICCRLIVEAREVVITVHLIWCVHITELNSNFVETDMKSQAYSPIWLNGPYLTRLQQGRDFFASGSHGVSCTQTINNDCQLTDFVSGVKIEVLGYVNCAYIPNISTQLMLRARLSESLVSYWLLRLYRRPATEEYCLCHTGVSPAARIGDFYNARITNIKIV